LSGEVHEMKKSTRWLLAVVLLLAAAGCSDREEAASAGARTGAAASDEEPLPPPAYESALPEDMRSLVDQSFTGDFDAMVKRRVIRVAVPFNRSF
jgi:hypothetical protein